jgi:hypothetical protein
MHLPQGSATLSMAYAGALFADACLRGLNGDSNVVEPTFVESKVTELPFFASKVRLGPSGEAAQHRQPSVPALHALRTHTPHWCPLHMRSSDFPPDGHVEADRGSHTQERRRFMGWESSTSTSKMA